MSERMQGFILGVLLMMFFGGFILGLIKLALFVSFVAFLIAVAVGITGRDDDTSEQKQ